MTNIFNYCRRKLNLQNLPIPEVQLNLSWLSLFLYKLSSIKCMKPKIYFHSWPKTLESWHICLEFSKYNLLTTYFLYTRHRGDPYYFRLKVPYPKEKCEVRIRNSPPTHLFTDGLPLNGSIIPSSSVFVVVNKEPSVHWKNDGL